jgi:hypothetical protein
MSKLGLVIILFLLSGKNYAQQPNYFVLIQADKKQPFYVRLGSQSLSSSPEGYLILSQLKDSNYNIMVGFPGQAFPEQAFSVDLRHKDQQFLLRNQGEKGWVLYNPLTGETKNSDPKEDKEAGLRPQGVKKDDAFSRLMAGVVRDTAVMYNTYAGSFIDSPVARSATRPDTGLAINSSGTGPVTTVAKTDAVIPSPDAGSAIRKSTVAASGSGSPVAATTGNDSSAAVTTPRLRRPDIVKLSQRLLFRGLRLIYVDRTMGKKTDTIVMIIPLDTPATSNSRLAAGAPTPAAPGMTTLPSGKTLHPADTSHRAAIRTYGLNPDAQTPVTGNTGETVKNRPLPPAGNPLPMVSPPVKTPLPFVNSDCHDFATDYDVDKLRVKMLESSKDDDRIQAARKIFKAKCFSTRQIRALSEVFSTDALKFRFFETAYPFAADDHFRELAGTLADPVYNSKFKAMTGQ